MAFEFIGITGVVWGYIFVVVIAGLALLVGKRKRDKIKANRLKKQQETPTDSPELEQVKEKSEEASGNSESETKDE